MPNGYYTTTGKTYGKVTTYHCNKGYRQFGKSNVLCTVRGWDKITLFCQIITCAPPSSISNGNVTQRDRWIYGADAKYSCRVGYTLIGQHTINCTVSGNWSHKAPACQVITCAPPSSISNGNVTQRYRWIYGTDAKYSCRAGYTLIGRHTINCTVSGNWSHEAPTCQALPDHKEQFSTPSIISATRARETTPQNNYITMDSGDMNHLLSSLPSHTTPYEQKQTDISIATTANTINKTIPPNNSPIPTNSSNKSLMLSAVPNYSSNGYWKKWICFGIAAIIVSTVLLIIKVICDRRKYGSYKTGSQFPEYHKETERATINFIGNRNCSLL
ncbi:E-selectin-like isoform X2 [Scyliorhinus canicula]|uniref:E-selectin-like isoform X2 n=1 Tax=Scyliorhinus canicula TaxID=7830 RepID=UPI0018F722DB|nr:E-selectin-like isoform X2 [Scyliorhinus canicula]XP_038676482.1 E-selectin-like isoform X2 [Scyliorhinus canicula]